LSTAPVKVDATTPEICLQVSNFVRRYGANSIVGPIDFAVHDGEFFSLLGPSGCGKSTTLRAIAGFESVDEGEIRLRGRAIQNVPPNKRGVGLVFQRHALFPHLNVWNNVSFGPKQHRVDRATTTARCAAAIELVGLKGLEERWPAQLSGGQQQRVALARSLVLEPPLLLLDEPLSSLDLKLRVQMREELRALQKRLRKTTIFVTHDQTEALAMSDRVAVLSNGRIEQIGTPWEIYNRPATRFVATFIGRSNRFTVSRLAREGGRWSVTTGEGLRLLLADGAAPPTGAGFAMIRAESVRVAPPGQPSAGENAFKARIVDREYLGEDIQFRVVTEQGVELVAARKANAADQADPIGAECFVSIDSGAVYLLA
jgi:ABC-type Fe3+/spermidine/putrescine transport system ATPase subunit